MSIGAASRITGVTVPTLRAWETRHGFPTPRREGTGDGVHRRYSPSDLDAIARVVAARQAGLSLDAAIATVRSEAAADGRPRSIFAALVDRHPGLHPRTLHRSTMLAISRAIEDEFCARAADSVLIAAFQTPEAYHPARSRWSEFARTASTTVVLAEFERTQTRRRAPTEVSVPSTSAVLREWAVICDAPAATACLVGWERPETGRPGNRRFEAIWSVDPAVTRAAARAALAIAGEYAPELALDHLAAAPTSAGLDPARLLALTDRIVGHLDASAARRHGGG